MISNNLGTWFKGQELPAQAAGLNAGNSQVARGTRQGEKHAQAVSEHHRWALTRRAERGVKLSLISAHCPEGQYRETQWAKGENSARNCPLPPRGPGSSLCQDHVRDRSRGARRATGSLSLLAEFCVALTRWLFNLQEGGGPGVSLCRPHSCVCGKSGSHGRVVHGCDGIGDG